eukprot:4529102-Pyramimonas_sp.AAC.1
METATSQPASEGACVYHQVLPLYAEPHVRKGGVACVRGAVRGRVGQFGQVKAPEGLSTDYRPRIKVYSST